LTADSLQKVLSNIKTNLNIAEIKEGSYLHTTVDGLYNAVKDTLDEVDEISNNFFIDTASEATLERFGNSVGLPRINNKYLGFSEYNKDATLQVDFYGNLKLMRKTLSAEQYAKYAALMNITLQNKGIELNK
jgi:hypothetical protein